MKGTGRVIVIIIVEKIEEQEKELGLAKKRQRKPMEQAKKSGSKRWQEGQRELQELKEQDRVVKGR